MTDRSGTESPRGGSDEGERKTGILYGYRLESWQTFKGDFETRHEAVGHAAIVGRIMDQETEVRWHESLWTEKDTPTVCGYCGYETHYLPLVRWVFDGRLDASPFCTKQCRARYEHENGVTKT